MTKYEAKELYEALQKITKIPVDYVYPISSVVARNLTKIRRAVIDDVHLKQAKIIKELSEKDATGYPKKDAKDNIIFGANLEEANKRFEAVIDKLKTEDIAINFDTVTETYAKECKLSGEFLYPLYDTIIIPEPIEKELPQA